MRIGPNIAAIRAHGRWMDVNAHNIAGVGTVNFKSVDATVTSGLSAMAGRGERGVDLGREIPEQIVIEGGFAAQAPTIKSQNETLGTLLDTKG